MHRVVAGDSLQSLAWREYGNASAWRAIAEANGIDDPSRLPTGIELVLPGRRGGAFLMVKPAFSNVIHVTIDGKKLPPEYARPARRRLGRPGRRGARPRSGSPSATRPAVCSAS